jgi:hypothetical protein
MNRTLLLECFVKYIYIEKKHLKMENYDYLINFNNLNF